MFSRPKWALPLAAVGALTVAALGLTGCTGTDPAPKKADVNTIGGDVAGSVDDAIANALKLSGSTEAVVGVWRGDKAYVRGYGDGVSAQTQFRAAQASQPMMCALLLDLAATGSLSLDRKIDKDLTRQSAIEGVTYRQLCDQTSGIADYKTGLESIFANNPDRLWAEQELLANGLANSPLSWPGLDVHLSDTNAVLLDRTLRIRERLTTSELLSKHVFEPSGMSRTSYPDNFAAAKIPNGSLDPLVYPVAAGAPVCEAGPTQLSELSTSMLRGAGASLTTVTDLKSFLAKYVSGGFGGEKLSSLVTDVKPAKNPARDDQGKPTEELDTSGTQIGFGVEQIGPLFGRSGSITGTITAAYTDPKSDLTVVVALNNSSAGAAFAQTLALQLAALSGVEMPWTAADQAAALAAHAVCQPAPAA